MPTLYVRDFPEKLQEKVKALAARNQRSVSAEVVMLIDQALKQEEVRERRAETLKNIARRRKSYKAPACAVDSLTMLREDRER